MRMTTSNMYCLKTATLLVVLLCVSAHVVPNRNQDTKTPTVVSDDYCPDDEAIYPCTCWKEGSMYWLSGINCKNIDAKDLERVFKANYPQKYYKNFYLTSKTINEIGKGFDGITFGDIDITAPLTKLDPQLLLTSNETLENLELKNLRLHHTDPVWAAIKDLKKLQSMYVDSEINTMPTLESDSIEVFNFVHNDLSSIPSGSLTGLRRMTQLGLFDNQNLIGASSFGDKSIPLMLGGTALSLGLNLDKNLSDLNPEMFAYPEGPSTVFFDLQNTNISTLSKKTFKTIIDRTSCLTQIDFSRSYYRLITCDCSLAWIFDDCLNGRTYRKSFLGKCDSGVDIQDLNPKDFSNCTTTVL